jgi:hypothetical protein
MAVTSFKRSLYSSTPDKYYSFLAGNDYYIPPSFESIATATGTGSSATITFNSIPSTYKSLQIRFMAKSTDTSAATVYNYRITFNGDVASNYARHYLNGNGATVVSTGSGSATEIGPGYTPIPNSGSGLASMMGIGIVDIDDYTSSTKNKTVRVTTGTDLNRTTAPTGTVIAHSGLWFATPAAITSITFVVTTGFWTTDSTFALYGVK